MLRFFSKFQRSRNFILLLFCLILLVGLIVFYIPSRNLVDNPNLAMSNDDKTVVAKVGSQEITVKEYLDAIRIMGSRFSQGNALPLNLVRQLGLDKEAIDRLIDEKVALAEAERLNIRGTDGDVTDQVTRTFVDPETGKFIGVDEYKRSLRLRGEDVTKYEANIRRGAALGRFVKLMTSAEQISDREVEDNFKNENTKVETFYAIVDLEKVRSKFKPTDSELQAYYDQHKDKFKPETVARKVQYIFIPTDEVAKTINPTEDELKKEYEQNKQFEPRVSIIKLNVLTPNDEQTVRAKIDELNNRIRGGNGAKPEDFAAVAKGNSQDASASSGGDIGFVKKNPNNSQDWKQRAFNVDVNTIDGPFRHGNAYYLLKVTEKREVPFADMRPTTLAGLRNRSAFAKASQLADKVYEKATEYKDLHKAADEFAKEMKLGTDQVLKTTPFFKKGDSLPEWGNVPQFESGIADLKKGDIGDKVQIPGGYAIPQVIDERSPGTQLTFEEARNEVEQELRREREPDLARQRATEIVTQAKTPAEFQSLLKAENIDVKTANNLETLQSPGAAAGGLQILQQARTAALNLKEGEISKNPIKWGAGYLVIAANKRTDPDMTRLPAERDGIRLKLLQERQNGYYDAYIKAARKQYEDQGLIKIYQDRIDSALNSGQ